jgi:hypothetical protein
MSCGYGFFHSQGDAYRKLGRLLMEHHAGAGRTTFCPCARESRVLVLRPEPCTCFKRILAA